MAKSDKLPKENNLAIASLVLGIISIVGFGGLFTGIPAIIAGFMSLKNPHNKNLGLIGLILGGIATVFSLLAILVIVIIIMIAAASASTDVQPSPQVDDTPFSEFRT